MELPANAVTQRARADVRERGDHGGGGVENGDSSSSPVFDWINHLLHALRGAGRSYDCFGILRPSSPLRQPEIIRRAWAPRSASTRCAGWRSSASTPGKMWVIRGNRMTPLTVGPQPWRSMEMSSLPEVYGQNAKLEIALCRVVLKQRNIFGTTIMSFSTRGARGFERNDPEDWWLLELDHATRAGCGE